MQFSEIYTFFVSLDSTDAAEFPAAAHQPVNVQKVLQDVACVAPTCPHI
jgi:hypothetical protein